jgi:hypothetical protein
MTRQVMVRYRVKPEQVAENEQLVAKVYEQLAREAPPGLRYLTFKLADGVTFVHIATIEVLEGRNPLVELAAFKAFSAGVQQRCDELPVTTEWSEVGSYAFFGR